MEGSIIICICTLGICFSIGAIYSMICNASAEIRKDYLDYETKK